MKTKHSKKRKSKTLIIVILLILIGFGIYKLYETNIQKVSDNTEQVPITEPTENETETQRVMQVKELQKENPDVVGWLEIEGTNINYPVLQGIDNEYYMTHTYKKEYSADGSIFLDKEYDWSLPSSNLLIYGHNNENGKKFCDLLKYQEESFYKEHPTIKFATNEEDCEFEIIASFLSRVYYKSEKDVFRYYFFINAENEQEFNDYVTNSKKASLYDTGKTAEYGDQLMTLSTCSYHTEDGRFAVVAKKKL